jgi:CP family cyanate transporter-like MFS transporter
LIVIIASVLMGGASLGLIWAPRWTSIWSWAAGIAGGVSFVLALSLFGLRTRTHHAAAALSGMAQSVGYALAATGPVLVGLLHDLMGGWQAPLMVLVLVSCCHLVFGLLASRSLVVDS